MKLQNIFNATLNASRKLNLIPTDKINVLLTELSEDTVKRSDEIIAANAKDLDRMEKANPMYDRLLLNRERIEAIAADIRNVATLDSPLDRVLSETLHSNGMKITKITVPFGVIGVIYEARPNVSFDVFSLCLKSGNASVLKGGSDAHNSNTAIVNIIKDVLRRNNIDENTVTLLPADREATSELLNAVGYVDLIIPRGSRGLIDFVRENSRIPVIETGAGICHTYVDRAADSEKAKNIVFNAKCRRISVCNALDTLVIHKDMLKDIAVICAPLSEKSVIIYADQQSFDALKGKYPAELLQKATKESYGTEFLSYKMSVKTVNDIYEAINHITEYSSKHSESIVTEDTEAAQLFAKCIDAACVYTNVSTAFTDGAQFGFGAEIGISTQKLHARGPMALPELTTYKYIITGNGQTRR